MQRDLPGAVAMYGPAARRDADADDEEDEIEEYDNSNTTESSSEDYNYDDSLGATSSSTRTPSVSGVDLPAGLMTASVTSSRRMGLDLEEEEDHSTFDDEEEMREDELSNYEIYKKSLKPETKSEKMHRLFISFSFVAVGLLGIIAVVLILVLLGFKSPAAVVDNSSPASSPTHLHPPPLPTQDESTASSAERWVMASEIVGSVASFGFNVDLSSDANVVAVAAPLAQDGRGQLQVFRRKNNIRKLVDAQLQSSTSTSTKNESSTLGDEEVWMTVGSPIVGDSIGDFASLGMDLSVDGSTVAVGYPGNGNGFVRVFQLMDGNEWKQLGQTLAGPSLLSEFGASVSILTVDTVNGTSYHVVVGAPLAGDQEQGMIQAYRWIPASSDTGGSWGKDGNVWYGENPGDRFGSSVGMSTSSNGNLIAVGAPGDDTRWEDGGRIYVLERRYKSAEEGDDCQRPTGCWVDEGSVTGEAVGNRIGQRVCLDPAGGAFLTSSTSYDERAVSLSSEQQLNTLDEETLHSLREQEAIGTGKIRLMTHDAYISVSIEIGFGVLGSRYGEGLGYDIALNHGAGTTGAMFAATSLNSDTHTGIARAFKYESGQLVQQGNDIEALPLGTGVWHGDTDDDGVNAGPSISMASRRLAVGYQSTALGDEEEAPGIVRIFSIGR